MAIWLMRVAYWILKAASTHSEYVIFIAFPRQKWFRESASMLGTCVSHYCLALSRRRFANAPPSFVIISVYARNRSIATERIVIRFHNIGEFYKDSYGRFSILIKIGRNDSRKLHAVLLASLT